MATKPATPEVDTAPPAETKADKFKRMASARVGKALDAIALIGNLSAKATYEYTPEQIDKIEKALLAEVQQTLEAFKNPGVAKKAGFDI